MSKQPTQMSDDDTDGHGEGAQAFSRRTVLSGAVAAGAGALVVGTQTASADGKGGQAIIKQDVYKPDATFEILEAQGECDNRHPDGSCLDFDKRLYFRCLGQGGRAPPGKDGRLPFPWWTLKYTDDHPTDDDGNEVDIRLYTRDNSIDTSATYRWTRKKKDCPETPGVYQVGFASDND